MLPQISSRYTSTNQWAWKTAPIPIFGETADYYQHKLVTIRNGSTTPVLEEFSAGKGTGTKPPACQTTLMFTSERQCLKSCKEQKKEIFIYSHTQEHWTELVSDWLMIKCTIN